MRKPPKALERLKSPFIAAVVNGWSPAGGFVGFKSFGSQQWRARAGEEVLD